MKNSQENSKTVKKGFLADKQTTGLFFVIPAVLFTLVFFIVPLLMTIWMSLNNWPLFGKHHFIGFENYLSMLSDRQFWKSLLFTTYYTVIITPIIFILAFILAMLVNLPLRGVGLFRTIYFIPVVIGLASASLLWVWLYNDQTGVINGILLNLGWIDKPIIWLAEKNLYLPSVVVSVVWKTVGFTMVLLLSGLQAIPEEVYQAAMVDGANFWSKLWYITLPLLKRTISLALVLSVIGSYLAFDQFFIMTSGGPSNQTITVVYWIFKNSFTSFKLGYGAALSIILMIMLILLSLVQMYLLRDDTSS